MRTKLPKPAAKAMLYQDEKLYVCLATHPITPGHVVIVWRKDVPDLKRLTPRDYDYLMDTVNAVRTAMIRALQIKKVYLIYMDEAQHVHWHLIPRYNRKGYDIFLHQPKQTTDFRLAPKIQEYIKL